MFLVLVHTNLPSVLMHTLRPQNLIYGKATVILLFRSGVEIFIESCQKKLWKKTIYGYAFIIEFYLSLSWKRCILTWMGRINTCALKAEQRKESQVHEVIPGQ